MPLVLSFLVINYNRMVMPGTSGFPVTTLATSYRREWVYFFFSFSIFSKLTYFESFGSFLCFPYWFGKARKSASSPTVCSSTTPLSLVIQADGNWVQHSEICQIQPQCPCKIAPAESHRTVFWGLRSLCLVYGAWRKGLSSDLPWKGEKQSKASLCWVYLIMAELYVTFGEE